MQPILGLLIIAAAPLFLAGIILLQTLVAAAVGWVVGLTFLGVWVSSGLAMVGIQCAPANLYMLTAAVGLLGGFFKAIQTNNTK